MLRNTIVQYGALSESLTEANGSNKTTEQDQTYQLEVRRLLSALGEIAGNLSAGAGYIVNMAGPPAVKPIVTQILVPIIQPWMQQRPGGKAPCRKGSLLQASMQAVSKEEESLGWEMWRCAACLLADIVEFGGGACCGAAAEFFSSALQFCLSQEVVKKVFQGSQSVVGFIHAAMYGIGLLAEKKGGKTLLQPAKVGPLVQVLVRIVGALHKAALQLEDEELSIRLGDALDNWVSAVGKFVVYQGQTYGQSGGNVRQLVQAWIRLLPLVHDEEEAVPAHALFARALGHAPMRTLILSSGGDGTGAAEQRAMVASICIEVRKQRCKQLAWFCLFFSMHVMWV